MARLIIELGRTVAGGGGSDSRRSAQADTWRSMGLSSLGFGPRAAAGGGAGGTGAVGGGGDGKKIGILLRDGLHRDLRTAGLAEAGALEAESGGVPCCRPGVGSVLEAEARERRRSSLCAWSRSVATTSVRSAWARSDASFHLTRCSSSCASLSRAQSSSLSFAALARSSAASRCAATASTSTAVSSACRQVAAVEHVLIAALCSAQQVRSDCFSRSTRCSSARFSRSSSSSLSILSSSIRSAALSSRVPPARATALGAGSVAGSALVIVASGLRLSSRRMRFGIVGWMGGDGRRRVADGFAMYRSAVGACHPIAQYSAQT